MTLLEAIQKCTEKGYEVEFGRRLDGGLRMHVNEYKNQIDGWEPIGSFSCGTTYVDASSFIETLAECS